jgi:hypothetical protein
MSLANQARALLGQSAVMRQDIFGTTADDRPVTLDYDGGSWTGSGYYSPIRYRQFTDDSGGFLNVRAAIVRFAKTVPFTPEIDKPVTIKEGETEILLRIDDIAGSHPLSVEWSLACKEQN